MVSTAVRNSRITSTPLQQATRQYGRCNLCEHRCGVNRLEGELGTCKASAEARVFRHRVECGEELELVPSHLFYLSGCDLRCAFCIAEQNAFDPRQGDVLSPEFLTHAITWGKKQGSRNIQWVGGEPNIHIPAILSAMSGCPELPRVVWKSDFYATPAAFELLEGAVDIFVADFKFGNNRCAQRIAKVEHYVETITRNLALAARQADLIVRHLLLPQHFECCYQPVVNLMRSQFPHVKFSIRDGYLPRWQARHYPDLGGLLEPDAACRARQYAEACGLNLIV